MLTGDPFLKSPVMVKASGYEWQDPAPRAFKSFGMQFFVNDESSQILDVDKFSVVNSVYQEEFSPLERELTEEIRRRSKRMTKIVDVKKGFQPPMKCFRDGLAMLLPRDNNLSCDWLTYRDPRYQKFILGLADDLYMSFGRNNQAVEECCRKLVVDYSMHAPYSTFIAHRGSMLVDESEYPRWKRDIFNHAYGKFLYKQFYKNVPSECLPYKRSKKSPGWPFLEPSGAPVLRSNYLFGPAEYVHRDADLMLTPNYSTLKDKWVDSGRVQEILDYWWQRTPMIDDPKTFGDLFEHFALDVHTEAFRINNADPVLNDLTGTKPFSNVAGKFFTKDRDWAFEDAPCHIKGGVYDAKKFQPCLAEKQHSLLAPNKRRPFFPGPNAAFSVWGIYFFRRLYHALETGPCSYPCNRPIFIQKIERFLDRHRRAGHNIRVLSLDRRTFEQFATDNSELLLDLYPPLLRRFLKGIGYGVVCSRYGFRGIAGSTLSGTSKTSNDSMTLGFYEVIDWYMLIAGLDPFDRNAYQTVVSQYMDALEKGSDEIQIGDYFFTVEAGSDDQCHYVASSKPIEFSTRDQQRLKKRWLTGGLKDYEPSSFGMAWSSKDFKVSETLGLSKILLTEKSKMGDAVAAKYAARFSLLPQFRDLFDHHYKINGFGHINDYNQSFASLAAFQKSYGYAVDPEFNEYNPTDEIIFKQAYQTMTEKYSFSGMTDAQRARLNQSDRYTMEQMQPFEEFFRREIFNQETFNYLFARS